MQLRNGYYSKESIKDFTNAHNRLKNISYLGGEWRLYYTKPTDRNVFDYAWTVWAVPTQKYNFTFIKGFIKAISAGEKAFVSTES